MIAAIKSDTVEYPTFGGRQKIWGLPGGRATVRPSGGAL
jgi:hypothetical protein